MQKAGLWANSAGLLILRLGVGAYMAFHGWGKVQMLFDGKAEDFGDPIGLGPTFSLVLAAGAEFVCAMLVMVGLGTRVAAVPVVTTMLVAAFVVHGSDPWTMEEGARLFFEGKAQFWGSKEPALLFAFPFLALALTGAGRISIDSLIFRRWRDRDDASTKT